MGHNQPYQYMHNGNIKWREETAEEYLYQQTKSKNSKKNKLKEIHIRTHSQILKGLIPDVKYPMYRDKEPVMCTKAHWWFC